MIESGDVFRIFDHPREAYTKSPPGGQRKKAQKRKKEEET